MRVGRRKTRIIDPEPGDLCWDNERLCVLVKIGNAKDTTWAKLMDQVPGMLQPYGFFLDLDDPEIRFGSLYHLGTNLDEGSSGGDVASLFTRHLDTVEWYKRGRDER